MSSMAGKVVIVTGAGSGIGRSSALRFAREGASVMVTDVREDKALKTVAMIAEAGGEAAGMRTDVGSATDVEAMVEATVDRFGQLDVLFNNAATVRPGGAVELSIDDWDLVWKTNVSSVFFGAKYAAPKMKPGSSIISTASMSGMNPDPQLIAYAATKSAVINLTKALAIDLTPLGIRVNCICPGITQTPAMRSFLADETLRSLGEAVIPSRRMGNPEDIAAVAFWLAGDDAAYVTGQAITVDGGLGLANGFSLLGQVAAYLHEHE